MPEEQENGETSVSFPDIFVPVLLANLFCLSILVAMMAYLLCRIRAAWIRKKTMFETWLNRSGVADVIRQVGQEVKKHRNIPNNTQPHPLAYLVNKLSIGGKLEENATSEAKPTDCKV